MTFEQVNVEGRDFAASSVPGGDASFEMTRGGKPFLRFGYVGCDKFSGKTALHSKFRKHESDDGLGVQFETEGVIPFGSEYMVRRELSIYSGIGLATLDVRAENHGKMRLLDLEDVEFPGEWAEIEYLIFGEAAPHKVKLSETAADSVLYEGSELPVFVRARAADGFAVEFWAGEDLWRHRCGIGVELCTNRFVLRKSEDGVVFSRRMFEFSEEAEIESRPWRFKNVFAWSSRPADPPAEDAVELTKLAGNHADSLKLLNGRHLPECCFSAAGTARAFRKLIRCRGPLIAASGAAAGFCENAAHLERSGKTALFHFDLESLVKQYCWANRTLKKQSGGFSVTLRKDSPAYGSAAAAVLSRPAEPLRDSGL